MTLPLQLQSSLALLLILLDFVLHTNNSKPVLLEPD